MNVADLSQMAIMTEMMSQQAQQLTKIQEMITESAVKLAEMSADPNLGQYVDIRV